MTPEEIEVYKFFLKGVGGFALGFLLCDPEMFWIAVYIGIALYLLLVFLRFLVNSTV